MGRPYDAIALGLCLEAGNADAAQRQAFLERYAQSDDRSRYHMLVRERQALLHLVHEKEAAIGQLDYMLHQLNQ